MPWSLQFPLLLRLLRASSFPNWERRVEHCCERLLAGVKATNSLHPFGSSKTCLAHFFMPRPTQVCSQSWEVDSYGYGGTERPVSVCTCDEKHDPCTWLMPLLEWDGSEWQGLQWVSVPVTWNLARKLDHTEAKFIEDVKKVLHDNYALIIQSKRNTSFICPLDIP